MRVPECKLSRLVLTARFTLDLDDGMLVVGMRDHEVGSVCRHVEGRYLALDNGRFWKRFGKVHGQFDLRPTLPTVGVLSCKTCIIIRRITRMPHHISVYY